MTLLLEFAAAYTACFLIVTILASLVLVHDLQKRVAELEKGARPPVTRQDRNGKTPRQQLEEFLAEGPKKRAEILALTDIPPGTLATLFAGGGFAKASGGRWKSLRHL